MPAINILGNSFLLFVDKSPFETKKNLAEINERAEAEITTNYREQCIWRLPKALYLFKLVPKSFLYLAKGNGNANNRIILIEKKQNTSILRKC